MSSDDSIGWERNLKIYILEVNLNILKVYIPSFQHLFILRILFVFINYRIVTASCNKYL